jgi:hypothetical protein
MHQTTVRFGPDLWADLEREAAALGVSTAQYVRDAATARVHYAADRREDERLGRALERVELERRAGEPGRARQSAGAPGADAIALTAHGTQVRRRAAELQAQARRRLEELNAMMEGSEE